MHHHVEYRAGLERRRAAKKREVDEDRKAQITMPDEKCFLLLETPVSAAKLANFLGRVVASPRRPSDEFAPFQSDGRPDHFAGDIIPDILPLPRVSAEKACTMVAGNGGGGRTDLATIFRLDFVRRGQQQRILDCSEVKRYRLENVKMTFENLMRNPYYRQDVEAFVQSVNPHSAYFVAGFITATNANWILCDKSESTNMIKATLSASGFAGMPKSNLFSGVLDVGGQAGAWATSARRSESRVQGEEIIAVYYYSVKLKYGYDFESRCLTRTPVIQRARRTRRSELSMAGEDEDAVAYDSESDLGGESSGDDADHAVDSFSDFPFVFLPVVGTCSDIVGSQWL